MRAISSVASRVLLARFFTSLATTAKPRPASPARAASIAALNERMLVVSAIWPMSREQARTWLIAAAKPVTCWVSVSTSSSSSVTCPSEEWISRVPSPSRSIARVDSTRDSSQASAIWRSSSSSAATVSSRVSCSARTRARESITARTMPATSEQPTVTAPQSRAIEPSESAPCDSILVSSMLPCDRLFLSLGR